MKARSEYRSNTFLIVLLSLLVVQGCASVPERHPLPEEKYAESRVLGMSDLRFWSDDPLPASRDLTEPTLEELQTLFPAFVGTAWHTSFFLVRTMHAPSG